MNLRTVAFALLSAALIVSAHHNMAVTYDFNNRVTLTGTLVKSDWRNPHIELFVDVKADNGQVEKWTLEGPSPSFFRNRDVSKSDFEGAFSKVVVFEASRARDGSTAGLLRVMTLPGGKVVSACPQNC